MHAIHFRPTVHLAREVGQSGRIAIVPALRTVLAGPGDMNGMGPRRRLQIPPEALLVLLFEPVAQGRQYGVVQRKALLQVADGENDMVDKPSHVTDAPSPLIGHRWFLYNAFALSSSRSTFAARMKSFSGSSSVVFRATPVQLIILRRKPPAALTSGVGQNRTWQFRPMAARYRKPTRGNSF